MKTNRRWMKSILTASADPQVTLRNLRAVPESDLTLSVAIAPRPKTFAFAEV